MTVGMSSGQRVLVVVHADDGSAVRIISARRATRYEQGFMKKNKVKSAGDMRPEYDFASMKEAFEENTCRDTAREPTSCFSIPRWPGPFRLTLPSTRHCTRFWTWRMECACRRERRKRPGI